MHLKYRQITHVTKATFFLANSTQKAKYILFVFVYQSIQPAGAERKENQLTFFTREVKKKKKEREQGPCISYFCFAN